MRSNLAPIGRRRHCEGPVQGGPSRGPTGPAGWYRTRPAAGTRTRPHDHPLQALQALRGPLRCHGTSLRGCWVVPGIALPVPHPVYPPRYTPPSHRTGSTADKDHWETTRTCTYGRFGTLVGEPRGLRTHPVFRSLAGYIQLFKDMRVYTAV